MSDGNNDSNGDRAADASIPDGAFESLVLEVWAGDNESATGNRLGVCNGADDKSSVEGLFDCNLLGSREGNLRGDSGVSFGALPVDGNPIGISSDF